MFFALKLELLIVAFFVIGCATSENTGVNRTTSKTNQNTQRTPIKSSSPSTTKVINCKVLDKDIAGQYSGGCESGLAHGNGTAKGRDTYEGEFQRGDKHGRGTYIWTASGNKYEGYWQNDLFHGWGVLTTVTGKYEGEWVSGKKHGKGTIVYANGRKDEGVWLNDHKQAISTNNSQTASNSAIKPGNADGTWEHQGTIWFRCFLGQTWSVDTQRCIGTAKDLPWDLAIKESHALNMLGKKWRLPTQAEMKSNSKLIQTRTNSMGGQFDLFSYAAPEGVFLDINYEVMNYPGMPSYRYITDSLWMLKLSERGGNPVRFLVRKSEFDGLTFNNTNFSRLVVNSNQDFSQIAIANQSIEKKKAAADSEAAAKAKEAAAEAKKRAYENSPAGRAEARRNELAREKEAAAQRAYENSPAGVAARQGRQMCEAQKQTCRANCPPYTDSDWKRASGTQASCMYQCNSISCN